MRKVIEEDLKIQNEALAKAITKIKECHDLYLSTLKINFSYLSTFPNEIRELKWLTSISITHTEIKFLPDWIGELENLRELDISGNQNIRKLPPTLVNLKYLKKLILDNTSILNLPVFLGKMKSLEILDISMYGLKSFPDCILGLPKLRRIETRTYDISHLPSLVKRQQELNQKECFRRIDRCKKCQNRKLNLSFLNLNELPENLSSLYWLEELDVSCNNIKELPAWIGNFINLSMLDIESNNIKFLPASIGNLKKLKEIRFNCNPIRALPESFGNLCSLSHFSFYNTSLKKLPESFSKLKSLRTLTIDSDVPWGFSFPVDMKKLKSLREVTIGSFDQIPDFIGELKNLTMLDISHNRLYDLPDFIGNLAKLRKLILHSTWITELPDWISKLKNLVTLDITCNDMEVYPEVIKKLPKLKKFWDYGNPYNTEGNQN